MIWVTIKICGVRANLMREMRAITIKALVCRRTDDEDFREALDREALRAGPPLLALVAHLVTRDGIGMCTSRMVLESSKSS